MTALFDFCVKFDPAVDTPEDLTKRIIYSLFVQPLKHKKPRVVFISGDSGEGKSLAGLRFQELMAEIQGFSALEHFRAMNIFTPLEYSKKIDALLNDKKLKKVNILCMHEARAIIKAKNWHSFLAQSIADVNAMSRAVKPICFMIISQFIRDITTDVRYTLNYYVKMSRDSKGSKMYVSRVWKDDRDLEKPKLRKRKIFGYVVYPSGRRRKIRPQYLLVKKPSKEIIELFDELDTQSKAEIIRRKLNRLVSEMELELQGENKKIVDMVTWYISKPEKMLGIGKMRGDKFILNKNFNQMHELTPKEKEEFVKILTTELKSRGIIEKKNIESYSTPPPDSSSLDDDDGVDEEPAGDDEA